MGIIRLSHCPSLIRKSLRNRTSRGTRLNFKSLFPLNRIAHASHAHTSFRVAGSSRCGCSAPSSRLHMSQVSTLVLRLRANWRSVANDASGIVFEEDTGLRLANFQLRCACYALSCSDGVAGGLAGARLASGTNPLVSALFST